MFPHRPQLGPSALCLSDIQRAKAKGAFLDSVMCFPHVTEELVSLPLDLRPGDRITDLFHPCFSFNSFDRKAKNAISLRRDELDALIAAHSTNASTVIIVVAASKPSDLITFQPVSVAHVYRAGTLIHFPKLPSGVCTSRDTLLGAIRLGISKATTLAGVTNIHVICPSLDGAKIILDANTHSAQAHSLATIRVLRPWLGDSDDCSLSFWDIPASAKWSLSQHASEDACSVRVALGRNPISTLDGLRKRCVDTCRSSWHENFCAPAPGHRFMFLVNSNNQRLLPSYLGGGAWLPTFNESPALCARACRALTAHAPIGEYRRDFFPNEQVSCPHCGDPLELREHILDVCPQYTRQVASHHRLDDFVKFLTDNPAAFAFANLRPPTPSPPSTGVG